MTEPQPSSVREDAPQPRNGSSPVLQRSTLVITNLGKLVGIIAFVNEAFVKDQERYGILLMCGLLVIGVQVAEGVVLRLIDRIFGGSYQ